MAASGLADGRAPRGAADRQLAAHRDRDPARDRGALRLAVAGAQGRRLVDRQALRFRARARRHHDPHRHLPHRDRRQPRSVRRVALSGPERPPSWCPTTTFDGEPLWTARHDAGRRPKSRGAALRYFDPYHAALAAEIARLRDRHPRVALYDCHSIRSIIPRLFPGELPVMNIGTNAGASLRHRIWPSPSRPIASASRFSAVINGRFKGGYITRHYGKPDERRARRADGAGLPRLHARARRAGATRATGRCRSIRPSPPTSAPRCAPILETCLHFAEDGNSRPA